MTVTQPILPGTSRWASRVPRRVCALVPGSPVVDHVLVGSVRARQAPLSENDMKKKSTEPANDDLRNHYDFDYSSMKPNRFAFRQR